MFKTNCLKISRYPSFMTTQLIFHQSLYIKGLISLIDLIMRKMNKYFVQQTVLQAWFLFLISIGRRFTQVKLKTRSIMIHRKVLKIKSMYLLSISLFQTKQNMPILMEQSNKRSIWMQVIVFSSPPISFTICKVSRDKHYWMD